MFAIGASICCGAPSRRAARATSGSSRRICSARFPSPARSSACWSMRRVPGSAPCVGTPISAGAATGGRLIYATCSSEPEENEAVADQFLAAAPDFAAADLRQLTTLLPADVIDARGHLRTYPHVHGLEAFFGA